MKKPYTLPYLTGNEYYYKERVTRHLCKEIAAWSKEAVAQIGIDHTADAVLKALTALQPRVFESLQDRAFVQLTDRARDMLRQWTLEERVQREEIERELQQSSTAEQ